MKNIKKREQMEESGRKGENRTEGQVYLRRDALGGGFCCFLCIS